MTSAPGGGEADARARLAAARAAGDQDALADALVDHATLVLEGGDLAGARAALDEAGAIHAAAGRIEDQVRALHLAATVSRALGELDESLTRARRAEALATPGTPPLVAAVLEQAEVAALRGRHDDAAGLYGRALTIATDAGLLTDHQARLRRKRAQSLAGAGRLAEAADELRVAHQLHGRAGTPAETRRTLVELAVVLEQAGAGDEVDATLTQARAEADAAGDAHVLADVELLAAGRAAARRAFDLALACARRARTHALAATAPLSYVSAAATIADVADALGDRATAYEALAAGWVTTGDVLGEAAARQLFEPRLRALRDAWGDAAFVAVRDAYNDRRRAVLRGDAS
ncbi:MAG: hypothetical protein KJZ91_30700 [Myxococcales bacterium]|nr:hypothetical protein [Myxococcales bacterium]